MTELDPMRDEAHPSLRALEQSAFDPAYEEISEHVASCESCRSKIEAMRAERDRFLKERPAGVFFAKLDAKQRSARSWWRWPALAVALGILLFAVIPKNEILLKGQGPVLELYASKHGEPATRLEGEGPLEAGDRIRFVVTAPAGFVMIMNVDDRGRITRYHPIDRSESARIEAGRHEIPGAIALDDFVGQERIFLLWSAKSFTEDEASRALAEAFAKDGLAAMKPVFAFASASIRKVAR